MDIGETGTEEEEETAVSVSTLSDDAESSDGNSIYRRFLSVTVCLNVKIHFQT